MSQFPAAASDEHAGESSGMASCDTFQKIPEERKSGDPAFRNPDHFPFMKLPVETRLEIYNYLLIACPSVVKSAILRKGASHGVSLEMYTTRDADQETKIACQQISSSGNACARIGLTPQTLRICKTIHQEAAPILYSINLFQFQLGESLLSSKPIILRQERLEYLRRKLYQDPAELWGVNDHESLICSPFAVFLRQIGQRNAASLKRLKFVGGLNGRGIDPMGQQAGAGIEVFTQLLKYHVPGARQVKICRDPDQWDEFEDGIFEVEDGILEVEDMLEDEAVSPALWDICTGSVPSLHLARPDEQIVMCRAIEELVEKVTWLKRLSVTGFGHDSPVSRKIEELEAIVKARR